MSFPRAAAVPAFVLPASLLVAAPAAASGPAAAPAHLAPFAPLSPPCPTRTRRANAQRRRVALLAAGGGKPGGTPDGGDPVSAPINLPSGLLLLLSSISAIAAIGCVFELTSGHPQYGDTVTKVILALSVPVFAFLYYAAIKKGQLEAELDP